MTSPTPRPVLRVRRALAAALASAFLAASLALLTPAGGALASPGASPSSSAETAPVTAATTSPRASQPAPVIQGSSPGAVETPPPAPQAPGEPFPWAFVVFGVLGVALLIAWAVLGRRERGHADDDETDDGGEMDDGGDQA